MLAMVHPRKHTRQTYTHSITLSAAVFFNAPKQFGKSRKQLNIKLHDAANSLTITDALNFNFQNPATVRFGHSFTHSVLYRNVKKHFNRQNTDNTVDVGKVNTYHSITF